VVSVSGFRDHGPGFVPLFAELNLGGDYSRDLESDPDSDPCEGQDLGR
jgi:hypothetical protein